MVSSKLECTKISILGYDGPCMRMPSNPCVLCPQCMVSTRLTHTPLPCRFVHDQEPLEVCEVLFAWDDKRGGDVVYAAGWNAQVGHAHMCVQCCAECSGVSTTAY